ncbi:MAG: TonB-dependent receptor plug domain-containing protein [Treponema sp.]|nr:TonB-dependent receptor plug domain-containing protein [Treponema sp.]
MKKRFLLSVIFLFAAFLSARDIIVTVEDADLGIPLEGAVIRSWDGAEYVCDEEGRAAVIVPEGRQVVIQAAYPGYENSRLVIPGTGSVFSLRLRLGGVLENRELVVEARKPETRESKPGRSVTISEKEITQSAEIGVVEDVMSAVKLLPGVSFTGMFSALPSIRGGDPGDLTAVMDGFYVDSPYHWGGAYSVFDPKMVRSARLSHGVFSSRYGRTISGLLEIASRKPYPTEMEADLGVSSSAASVNLSVPLAGKGGVMVMGKITYWDPFVWVMKQFVDMVNYVQVAPYIRDGAFSANYRFTPDLEVTASGFIGADGAAAYYQNEGAADYAKSVNNDMRGDWQNRLGFLIAGLTWNPRQDMVLKTTVGAGFLTSFLDAFMTNSIYGVRYSDGFIEKYGASLGLTGASSYDLTNTIYEDYMDTTANFQWRGDFDWDLGKGFLFAAGAEEVYTRNTMKLDGLLWVEQPVSAIPGLFLPGGYLHFPVTYVRDVSSGAFQTSGYTLLEYAAPDQFFGAELGLRLDHLYYAGEDVAIQTVPALSPRLNLDFLAVKNRGILDSLTLTAGTGLFSSMTDSLFNIRKEDGVGDTDLRQNRSWTSIAGAKFEFAGLFGVTLEGYYKSVFDRAYRYNLTNPDDGMLTTHYNFDGEGRIWGIDLMAQKYESRYWDGWLAYSFNYARYRDPAAADTEQTGYRRDWYYPSFHRFHNINLVLNIRPVPRFNIYTRFGFAGGTPYQVVGKPESYPVAVKNADGSYNIIEKWKRSSVYSDTRRTPFSLPLDVKFSWYRFNPKGKVQSEIYLAVENVLWFVDTGERNTTFNTYTGKEEEGSMNANYGLPIPMISFGFKWSY